MDFARGSDARVALEKDARVNHGVGPDCDVGVDVGGGRVDQRDAGGHQLFIFLLADHAADLCELGSAVDAADLVGLLRP